MMIWSINRVFAHAVLLTLVGWPAPGPAHGADALVAVGDELALGKNRTGESCKLRLVESRSDLGGYTRYSLFCEGWTQQLKLMGEQATSHPSFWAPFVLVGDGGAP